jgi:hypothetical protein
MIEIPEMIVKIFEVMTEIRQVQFMISKFNTSSGEFNIELPLCKTRPAGFKEIFRKAICNLPQYSCIFPGSRKDVEDL